MKSIRFLLPCALLSLAATTAAAADSASKNDELQLPRSMHTTMKDRPRATVGLHSGDITGVEADGGAGAVLHGGVHGPWELEFVVLRGGVGGRGGCCGE